MRKHSATLTYMIAFVGIAVALAVGQDTRSTQTGVYTEKQAERGLKAYDKNCGECHDPAEFTGGFMDGWAGQTAFAYIESIAETMPLESPGGLKPQEFVDVVAFLFKVNGLPTGETQMDYENIKEILIEGPFSVEE
jgi:mono/diheme cytochrome c family protein